MRYLIDPTRITDFNRSTEDLQAFWLFCICVAGKNSRIQAYKLAMLLEKAYQEGMTPFEYVEHVTDLEMHLREVKLGQYNRLVRAFKESAYMDMSTVSLEHLENIFGVGQKTARFFLLHSRPNQQYAVLDTHILKWFTRRGYLNVPKKTPRGFQYLVYECLFLAEALHRKCSPAELDLSIWTELSS